MLYRYAPKRVCFILVHYGIKYIFIQRGVFVVRSTMTGNAKASRCGMSNK